MKSFYEFVQILKENESSDMLRTGEDRRKHFGIQGTGGGRVDNEVIYNNMGSYNQPGDDECGWGELVVWFKDDNDLEDIMYEKASEIVHGYGERMGGCIYKYKFTVSFSDDPSKSYISDNRGMLLGLPESHGSGIVRIEITDAEKSSD